MAAGEDRGHGGNAGYDDQIDAFYSWDSKVPNHRSIAVGDAVAIWDKRRLLGMSVVEQIDTSHGLKTLNRCVRCGTTRISARKRMTPVYRCMKCKEEFDVPAVETVSVVLYTARHDAAWTSLDGLLDGDELRSLATHAGDINAMRPLDWAGFQAALTARGAGRAVDRVDARTMDLSWSPATVHLEIPQGFRHTMVRVRRGQRQFRDRLLQHQGGTCAFTGAAPERVLEAGHLYSYAELGTHYEHGGLLLRRDIHRLFDDGLLAVSPEARRIDVAPELARFPQYARLQDGRLTVPLHDNQADWLDKHWQEHRRPMSAAPSRPG